MSRQTLVTGIVAFLIVWTLAAAVVVVLIFVSPKSESPTAPAGSSPPKQKEEAGSRPEKEKPASGPQPERYPYPECARIVKAIKDSLGEPDSLQIIEWVSRRRVNKGDNLGGVDRLGKPLPPVKEGFIWVDVKFRAKNNVGAMEVEELRFFLTDGGKLSTIPP